MQLLETAYYLNWIILYVLFKCRYICIYIQYYNRLEWHGKRRVSYRNNLVVDIKTKAKTLKICCNRHKIGYKINNVTTHILLYMRFYAFKQVHNIMIISVGGALRDIKPRRTTTTTARLLAIIGPVCKTTTNYEKNVSIAIPDEHTSKGFAV